MGKALLDTLSRVHPTATVVCVNRGKFYWYFLDKAGIMKPGANTLMCKIFTATAGSTRTPPLQLHF